MDFENSFSQSRGFLHEKFSWPVGITLLLFNISWKKNKAWKLPKQQHTGFGRLYTGSSCIYVMFFNHYVEKDVKELKAKFEKYVFLWENLYVLFKVQLDNMAPTLNFKILFMNLCQILQRNYDYLSKYCANCCEVLCYSGLDKSRVK